jgi:hypothetical protein
MDLQTTLSAAEQAVKTIFKSMTDDMQMCVQNCAQCSQVCEQMIQHCLTEGGAHAETRHIRLLQDCSDICALSARSMIRESSFHRMICEVCSEACFACAQDCERFAEDDLMKTCADVCRRCAESCQKMSVAH